MFQFACSLKSSLAPLYLSSSLLILNSQKLQSTDESFDLIIEIRKLPLSTNIRKLIACTGRLFSLFPPEKLLLHFPKLKYDDQDYDRQSRGRRRRLMVLEFSVLVLMVCLLVKFIIK